MMKKTPKTPETNTGRATPDKLMDELTDEEWERLAKDEPHDFPRSYYLCKQDPEKYDGMDV